MSARILIVNGNTQEATGRMLALGARPYGEGYGQALRFFVPDLDCKVLNAADGETLDPGTSLSDFDGVAWTGSALSAYADDPAVHRQIELARAVFEAGTPCFGSCWGMQLMCTALGGEVRANPKGIEIGIARRIRLTKTGRGHPMFAGKADVFDALAVHRDEISVLPDHSVVLAANDLSDIQALEIAVGQSHFWGVQYHPEFDFQMIGILIRRDAGDLIAQGYARERGDLNRLSADYQSLHQDPNRKDLSWQYGLDKSVLDPALRMGELGNWLKRIVLPRANGAS